MLDLNVTQQEPKLEQSQLGLEKAYKEINLCCRERKSSVVCQVRVETGTGRSQRLGGRRLQLFGNKDRGWDFRKQQGKRRKWKSIDSARA